MGARRLSCHLRVSYLKIPITVSQILRKGRRVLIFPLKFESNKRPWTMVKADFAWKPSWYRQDLSAIQGWPIITICSEYGCARLDDGDALEEVSNFTSTHSSHLSDTHTGKRPLCVPSSKGANFHPAFEAFLSAVSHLAITKSQYSASTNTGLEQILGPRTHRPQMPALQLY